MTASVDAVGLRRMLQDGGEIAVLDMREQAVFAKAHLLLAAPLPLSRLECRIDDLVPRRGTRIVCCDDDDGLAHRGARRLAQIGYTEASVLEGGVAGWAAAGFELFSGVNVPSKAFGEFVEQDSGTPSITAANLDRAIAGGEDLVILDSRPPEEFRMMSIPGAINLPGAELVSAIADVAPAPETLVVVNCAGRTRSIIGAQSLINAGIDNRVVALKDGTMGWQLAGLKLDHGNTARPPSPSPRGLARGRQRAAQVADRFGVARIDGATLEAWRAADQRTVYLFDLRGPDAYRAGHLAGARPAPGGQLVQATDGYMATRGARVVLLDDDGARAPMTASWLMQMGWREVAVLDGGIGEAPLQTGDHMPFVPGLAETDPATLSPRALAAMAKAGTCVVIDLANSRDYREGHIPGAWFAIRARLADALARPPATGEFVLTSGDGILARLAASELMSLVDRPVTVLAGGTAAWRAAGLPLASGPEHLAAACDDVWLRPYDRTQDNQQAMRDYLTWEVGLIDQIARDGGLRFQPASARA